MMKKEQIVSQDPQVMHGTLVFAGTRVPVESLIQHLVAGDSLDVFLDDFPTVSREQAVAYLQMTLEFGCTFSLRKPAPLSSTGQLKSISILKKNK